MTNPVALDENRASLSLSIVERDRRYALLREHLRDRGVDCAIAASSNLFYLTNGVLGERHGLLPTEELPPTVAVHDRNLVDLPPEALGEMQGWVDDIRPGNDASPLGDRIRELHLERGVIGLTDSTIGYGGMSHGICTQLQAAYPSARFIDVSDVFANVRTLKSVDELTMIERANRIFDAGIDAVCRLARPGMLGARVVHEGIMAMWAAGADLNSTLGFSCWPVPRRNHVLSHLTLSRRIEPGDVGILTGLAFYGRYAGHSDQEICFGAPKPLHREMFEAVTFVRDAVLNEVKPGATHGQLVAAYRQACQQSGFRPSSQSQIHQYGTDVPEFPGPAFAAAGVAGDFVLHSGMVYSISPAVLAPEGEDTVIGGTSLAVTHGGYRELGNRRVELRAIGE